jgi:hypothetical protein
MLSAALKAKGYNNYQSYVDSGEQYFLKNILSEINPKVCVDVGANVGEYTKAPNDLLKRDPKDPYSNIYVFSNFVFIRNDFFTK